MKTDLTKYFPLVIRVIIGLLFLRFGVMQMIDAGSYIGYLPEWTGYMPIPAEMLVHINGWFEVVLSLCLIAGVFTRLIAVILGVHLFAISLALTGDTRARDLALALISIALAMVPSGEYSIDNNLK